jgi:preprotein translocase subunit SecF
MNPPIPPTPECGEGDDSLTDMLHLTVVINVTATVSLAAAVAVLGDSGIFAVGLAYISGILTIIGSRYHVGVSAAPDPPE